MKQVNLSKPLDNDLSPEKAKYNRELMAKTLLGEASIIGTYIIKPEKQALEEDEDGEDGNSQQSHAEEKPPQKIEEGKNMEEEPAFIDNKDDENEIV